VWGREFRQGAENTIFVIHCIYEVPKKKIAICGQMDILFLHRVVTSLVASLQKDDYSNSRGIVSSCCGWQIIFLAFLLQERHNSFFCQVFFPINIGIA